jgi:SulP family sulfate permease
MIGQSMINISSGGRGRLSGIVAGLGLLAFIMVGAFLIEMVPLAALVGVMFMVVIATFEWTTFRILHRMPRADAVTVVLVTLVTVFTDLAIAVAVGIVWSALVFAWYAAKHMNASTHTDEAGSKVYELHGPLFFASTASFRDLFTVDQDPGDVIIDFRYTRVWDHSGIEAINALAERYRAAGKTLHLRHLSRECRKLLDRAGDFVEANRLEDPDYHIADDRLG